ncbi:MAG TPA: bifunctional serine/threonine-protein kinase/formylglycine-generating enzyme family protein [Planctomycetota bacterium]|nr:bifunctional serine/threonine-protein kinase/formylglycine-generating enzyme family protein [Planctomycetota bacterium]
MEPQDPSAPPGDTSEPEDFLGELVRRLSTRSASFARYSVQGEVARGGMGAILRVRDEDLRRDLAMKVVLPRGGAREPGTQHEEARVLGRFLEEAQVTGQLDHPGIVPVHELGLDAEGRVYFTMRLVAGRDLEKILGFVHGDNERWTQTRAVGVVLKVCEAVAYAHEKGVIHRDLKPANIMVGRFGEVYVMDWGLARVLGRSDSRDIRLRAPSEETRGPVNTSLRDSVSEGRVSPLVTMDGDIVGTPAYMSPEQARGDLQAIGPASDVYAVGAILYHLLAGHMPYAPPGSDRDAIEIWRRVRVDSPETLRERAPEAPGELVAICTKAMARDAKDRYGGMLELAEDLRAYLEGRVVRAYERGLFAETRKWILRNRTLAGTIAAAVVIVLVGSITASFVLARKNEQLSSANTLISASEVRARDGERRAIESEGEARKNAALAEERATRILRLSDLKRLEDLVRRADVLWPASPRNAGRYDDWLAEAREVAGRLAEHEKALGEIRQRGVAAGDKWTFPTPEEAWQHDTQEELVARLKAFADPERGRITDVERRLAFARTIEERSRTGTDAAARWKEAIASLADPRASPAYGGLALAPQLGLLPIGRDPHSGLWEFADLQTGVAAVRNAETGELEFGETNGLVFVLVPGGTFEMGAQADDPTGPHYDPQAGLIAPESPVQEVALAPFFLSKYEMTQGQWLRFVGRNPSTYGPGSGVYDGKSSDLAHPVEQVSWDECDETTRRLGLELPTEAQWEYAARAGTNTPWWTGEKKESLAGAANLADRSAARVGAPWSGIADWPELDDGWAVHAPVNAFRANPFGLLGVHGNVWEWCRDWLAAYGDPVREGDGERETGEHKYKVSRGGSFHHEAAYARASTRNNSVPETRSNHLGLRPARRIER